MNVLVTLCAGEEAVARPEFQAFLKHRAFSSAYSARILSSLGRLLLVSLIQVRVFTFYAFPLVLFDVLPSTSLPSRTLFMFVYGFFALDTRKEFLTCCLFLVAFPTYLPYLWWFADFTYPVVFGLRWFQS